MSGTHRRGCGVTWIGVKVLSARTSAIIAQVGSGATYVVTRGGRPTAALIPIEDAEDHVLANADEYVRIRRRSRVAHAEGRTTSLKNLA